MAKGIVTAVLSETLVQVIFGLGFPSAEQFKVNSAGATTVWLLEVVMLLGGATTTKDKKNKKIHFPQRKTTVIPILHQSSVMLHGIHKRLMEKPCVVPLGELGWLSDHWLHFPPQFQLITIWPYSIRQVNSPQERVGLHGTFFSFCFP